MDDQILYVSFEDENLLEQFWKIWLQMHNPYDCTQPVLTPKAWSTVDHIKCHY